VWASVSSVPITRFSTVVSARLTMYFQRGIPPASAAPFSASREPSTRSASPRRIGSTNRGISVGSYWPSGWSITIASAPRWSASR
jgi:hypothetical protein